MPAIGLRQAICLAVCLSAAATLGCSNGDDATPLGSSTPLGGGGSNSGNMITFSGSGTAMLQSGAPFVPASVTHSNTSYDFSNSLITIHVMQNPVSLGDALVVSVYTDQVMWNTTDSRAVTGVSITGEAIVFKDVTVREQVTGTSTLILNGKLSTDG